MEATLRRESAPFATHLEKKNGGGGKKKRPTPPTSGPFGKSEKSRKSRNIGLFEDLPAQLQGLLGEELRGPPHLALPNPRRIRPRRIHGLGPRKNTADRVTWTEARRKERVFKRPNLLVVVFIFSFVFEGAPLDTTDQVTWTYELFR